MNSIPINGMSENLPQKDISTNTTDNSYNNTIWAKFSDKDNIVDNSDVKYTQENKESKDINEFLETNKGKTWTTALKEEFNQIIDRFNLECEGDSLCRLVDQMFMKNKKSTTGNMVAIYNNDGTTSQIDLSSHTITQYDSKGQVINKREMTPEERALPTNKLIEHLQTVKETSEQETVTTNNHVIQDKGIKGTYQLIETENGYKLKMELLVSSANNQAAKAFLKGLANDFGMPNIEPDKQGYYNYRGIKSRTYNTLYATARSKAKEIAMYTAIYTDIMGKSKKGKTLSAGEQKFLEDYRKLLDKRGLKINDKGVLEDV